MRALTVRQPWAWAICAGHKDVENRVWATDHRGRLLIHAAARPDLDGYATLERMGLTVPLLDLGAVVGEVAVLDCVRDSRSRWAVDGHWHWLLGDAVLWPEARAHRGQPGLFEAKLA